jgi:hypothetical protein
MNTNKSLEINIDLLTKLINNHFQKLNQIKELINQQDVTNILWSSSSPNDLRYISGGVPNAAYYDKKLNGVVKFPKSEKELYANLKFIEKSKEEIENDKNIIDFIYKEAKILTDHDYINKLNTLETFCHIKGYVIYHNIYIEQIFRVASSPLIEYLENFNDIYTYTYTKSEDDWLKALPAFLEVVKDFNKFNTTYMFAHRDLQYNCRNMMYNEKSNKFKVIDIETPSLIISSILERPSILVHMALYDVIGLYKCYKNLWKPINFTFITDESINNLIEEFLNMNEHLLCAEDINKDPWVIYHPLNERPYCEKKDIYINTSNQAVQDKIIKFIDEYYIKLIDMIEQHIKNSQI